MRLASRRPPLVPCLRRLPCLPACPQKNYDSKQQTLRALTIKQLHDANSTRQDDTLLLDGKEITNVSAGGSISTPQRPQPVRQQPSTLRAHPRDAGVTALPNTSGRRAPAQLHRVPLAGPLILSVGRPVAHAAARCCPRPLPPAGHAGRQGAVHQRVGPHLWPEDRRRHRQGGRKDLDQRGR